MPPVSKTSHVNRSATVNTKAGNLAAVLCVPETSTGLVVFTNGSGSSSRSPSSIYIANELNKMHLGTMLLDMLTEDELNSDLHNSAIRSDMTILTKRLIEVLDWIANDSMTNGMKLGILGTGLGAATAIEAATHRQKLIRAVVCKSGNLDAAAKSLHNLTAPTLLIAGGDDRLVLSLNRHAFESMSCVKKLSVIVGADQLFTQSGELEQLAHEAGNWFHKFLR